MDKAAWPQLAAVSRIVEWLVQRLVFRTRRRQQLRNHRRRLRNVLLRRDQRVGQRLRGGLGEDIRLASLRRLTQRVGGHGGARGVPASCPDP
jgi:hypothetical protein